MRRAALIVLFLVVCALARPQKQPDAPRSLRVGVWTLWHDPQIIITSVGAATFRSCEGCGARNFKSLTVRANHRGLDWIENNGAARSAKLLFITGNFRISAHGETLGLSDPLRVTQQSGGLSLAATVPLERYVELVVAAESGAADGLESLKALAVVARSFALQPRHGHAVYDVCDSTHCQWLRWRSTPEAHAATLATAGESLWFAGKPAEAYFHQNCGGRTASAEEIWPGRDARPYLVSRIDSYCPRAGSSEWSATISHSDLTSALAAAGLAPPGWKTLTVLQRGESGRAVKVAADGRQISAEDFRLAVGRFLGWNKIRSNWFEVAAQGDGFLFHGRGSGHGVGLCQVGAAEMGRQGRSYNEILRQYFPGAVLGEVKTGAEWQNFAGQGFVLQSSDPSYRDFVPVVAQALAEAEQRSGLRAKGTITLRAFHSPPAFRDATLAPGWVAAFTEGDEILLQPLSVLAARKLLPGVLRHEFLHALIEEQATAKTPLWLREGLVEGLAADSPVSQARLPSIDSIHHGLAHAQSEAESEAAHRAAEALARRLLDGFGRAQLLVWLRNGVPQNIVDAAIRE